MSEVLKTQYVNQRQFGVIAPDKDPNGVKRLITSGMYPCFGVAIFDQESNVGMFTHLDYDNDLTIVLDTAYPALETLGANKLAVITVNIDSPHLLPYGGQRIVDTRRRELDKVVKTLTLRNVSDGTDWSDCGVSKEAIFEPKRGIIPATFEQLDMTMEQINAAYDYQSKLAEITKLNNGNTRALVISCAYMPEGIEIKTPFSNLLPQLPYAYSDGSKTPLFNYSGTKPILSKDQIDGLLRDIRFPKHKPLT